MSWKARPRSRAGPSGGRRGRRLEDRQHHLADHRRRAVHVHEQVVPGGVAVDRQVHRHRGQEPAEHVGVVAVRPHGVHDRPQHRIVGSPRGEVGEEPVAVVGQRALRGPRPGRRRGRRRCRLRTGRRRRAPTRGGARGGAGPATTSSRSCRPAVDALGTSGSEASSVARDRARRCRRRRRHGSASPTRSAASMPDTSTIGMPTPGTVPDPANTRPGARRVRRWPGGTGRSGGTCAPARTACPAPCPAPPSRAGRPAPRPRRRTGSRPRRPPRPGRRGRGPARSSSRPARRGSAPARARTARGGPGAPGSGRSTVGTADQPRRVGHAAPVAEQRAERVVPRPAEVDVVVGRPGRQRAADTGVPDDGGRRVAAAARPRGAAAARAAACGRRPGRSGLHTTASAAITSPPARRTPRTGPSTRSASRMRSTGALVAEAGHRPWRRPWPAPRAARASRPPGRRRR